jgi:hypothetical protein
MALVQCPECHHKVSTHAKACPKCAYPIQGNAKTNSPIPEPLQQPSCPSCNSPNIQKLTLFYSSGQKHSTATGFGLTLSGDVGIGTGSSVSESRFLKELKLKHPLPQPLWEMVVNTTVVPFFAGIFLPPLGFVLFTILALYNFIKLVSQESTASFNSKFVCFTCGEVHRRNCSF